MQKDHVLGKLERQERGISTQYFPRFLIIFL